MELYNKRKKEMFINDGNIDTDETATLDNIRNRLDIGTFIVSLKRVTGGLMHKMYRLETNAGIYAVKLLNHAIMTRPDAFKNYETAERLEKRLQENDIPIVPALEFDGKKMQCINNRHFYIFEWIAGYTLTTDEIKKEHCEIIGTILARIHKIERGKKSLLKNGLNIDWDFYIEPAREKCPEVLDLLKANKELLYKSQAEGNAALRRIPNITVISNGDMDSKNVLWVGNKPKIIDLECLGYGNPYTEVFQLALCWSGYEHRAINYDLLKAFIKAYTQEWGTVDTDWEDIYKSNFGKLEWLEYNIKRALMLECGSQEEKQLGVEQVEETMSHIVYYDSVKEKLLGELGCF